MPMTLSSISSSSQACAACKYQRRKCAPDCALAPYFPHDRQKQFLNAHKLFGVSNITKIIKKLPPLEKDIAMRTIVFQSDMRAKDPVGGCCSLIKILYDQIEHHKAELDLVLQHIASYQQQQQLQHHNQQQQHQQHQQQQQQQEIEVSEESETLSSYELFHNYNDNQGIHTIPMQHDQNNVNAQQRFDDDHNDDEKGSTNVLTHHHRTGDFQHSWGLHDSMWIQSKGSCIEGSPLAGEDDRVEDLKSSMGHNLNLGHDHLEMATFEVEVLKFDPQVTTKSREMMLKVEHVTLDGEKQSSNDIQFQSLVQGL